MKREYKCSFLCTMKREKIEETCCLHALGELSFEETSHWEQHLQECETCRNLTMEYKQIMLFDLPAIAVTQSESELSEDLMHVDEIELLASVRERANALQERRRTQIVQQGISPRESFQGRRKLPRSWKIASPLGWAAAAVLLLVLTTILPVRKGQQGPVATAPKYVLPSTDAAALEARIIAAERQVRHLQNHLMQTATELRSSKTAYSRLNEQSQDLAAANSTLEAQLKEDQSRLAQENAELELTRQNLSEQIAAKNALSGKLTDVYARLDKERSEVARLEHVALSTPSHFPVSNQPLGNSDAREILGARDLHIVDVYDVDNSGKPARAYGRIYFVNNSELIFYAFDLSKLESGHKVVAFQAWGFRQPQSTKVESLGLFYLENAILNRWTLRVSDPQILSRIDSLFVTVEPPGGSQFPKGKRLLMASLAGPPNHP